MKKLKKGLFVLAPFVLAGCMATMSTMQNAPLEKGKSKNFKAGYNKVIEASRSVLSEKEYRIAEDKKVDDNSWVIIGDKFGLKQEDRAFVRTMIKKVSEEESVVFVYDRDKRMSSSLLYLLFLKPNRPKDIFTLLEAKLR